MAGDEINRSNYTVILPVIIQHYFYYSTITIHIVYYLRKFNNSIELGIDLSVE